VLSQNKIFAVWRNVYRACHAILVHQVAKSFPGTISIEFGKETIALSMQSTMLHT
jgi:hypothetical protein